MERLSSWYPASVKVTALVSRMDVLLKKCIDLTMWSTPINLSRDIAHVLQPCCMSGSPYSTSFVEVDTECLEKRSRSVEETNVLVVVEASHS